MADDQPDPRPRPQYGEYAPPGWVPPQPDLTQLPPPNPATAASSPTTVTKSTDATVSLILLGLGFLGTAMTWITCIDLRGGLTAALAQRGVETGTLPEWIATAGIALAVGHVVLYLFTVLATAMLVRRKRRAAWLPLSAGILAAIAFWTVLSTAVAPFASQVVL